MRCCFLGFLRFEVLEPFLVLTFATGFGVRSFAAPGSKPQFVQSRSFEWPATAWKSDPQRPQ